MFIIKNKGFTLIEITIVIAIIAILAAVALLNFSDFFDNANSAQCQANRTEIERAERVYTVQYGANSGSNYTTSIANLINRDFFVAEPKCKAGGTYSWVTDSAGNRYVRCSIHASAVDTAILNTNEQSLVSIVQGVFSTSGVSTNWGSNYNDDYWNGQLELLLQEGTTATSVYHEGTNAVGYVNPVSGNTAIFNWKEPDILQNASYSSYAPPAVFISNSSKLSYENVESYQYISSLLGTMIVYKSNSSSSVQIYYIDANGKKSALTTVP